MPQVPYNPVPGVRDLGRPIYPGTGAGPISVHTPDIGPDAFGYQIGTALEHFGTVTQQTGQELFGRAEAFKKLDNSNDANTAAIDAANDQTKLFESLKEKEGKNAVDAFTGFNDKLEEIRQAHRPKGSLDAQREYDQLTRTQQSRLFANGASYAGSQHKAWTDGVGKAKMTYDINNVSLMPQDVAQIDKMLDAVKQSTESFYGGAVGTDGKGWDPDSIAEEVKKNQSTALSFALEKLGRVDATTAMTYLKKYQQTGQLSKDDVARTEERIRNPGYQQLTRGIMADATTGRLPNLGQHKVSIERARDAIGQIESDNDYSSHPNLVSYPKGHPEGCRSLGRYQVMDCFLGDYLKEAGMDKMTPEEFLKNPGKQDELFTKVFQQRMDKYGNFDDAASSWLSGVSRKQAMAEGRRDLLGTDANKYLGKAHARLWATAGANERSAAAQEKGQQLDPDNDFPLLPQYLDQAVQRQNAIQEQKKKEINYDNYSTVLATVNKVDQDGKYEQNFDHMMADPAVARAWNNITDKQRENIMNHLHANIDRGYEETEAKRARYKVLDGMLDTAEGKSKFQNEVDLTEEKLPNKYTDALMKKFKANKTRWGQDEPTVAHINQAYGSIMQSAGISRTKTPDDYYSFLSAVQGAWDAHTEQYGKPPSPQEKQMIGAQLLQERASRGLSGYFWGKEKMFQVIPDDDKERIINELRVQYKGAEPQEHQVERAYFTDLFNKMFQLEKGKGDRTVSAPPAPAVPVSR